MSSDEACILVNRWVLAGPSLVNNFPEQEWMELLGDRAGANVHSVVSSAGQP